MQRKRKPSARSSSSQSNEGSSNDGFESALPQHPSYGFQDSESAFPFKIYALLEDSERFGFSSIVSWVNGGTAFIIHDRTRFADEVLPLYFDKKKIQFKSFQRQLNLYRFQSIKGGSFRGAYTHPHFLRANKRLCHLITRERPQLAKAEIKDETKASRNDFARVKPPLPNTSADQKMRGKQNEQNFQAAKLKASMGDTRPPPSNDMTLCAQDKSEEHCSLNSVVYGDSIEASNFPGKKTKAAKLPPSQPVFQSIEANVVIGEGTRSAEEHSSTSNFNLQAEDTQPEFNMTVNITNDEDDIIDEIIKTFCR